MPERLQTRIVPPVGPLDAKIIWIGEAPGADEDMIGQPFVGSAGQLLNRCFKKVHVARSQQLLNNVFCQRPPRNLVNHYYSDKSNTKPTWEGREHIERLRRWLEGLNPRPNLIVALGYTAIHTLCGKRRVWKWRGSVLPCTLVPGYKVYCTLHPSGVNRLIGESEERLQGEKKAQAQNALPLFIRDIERCIEQAEFPEIRYPRRTIVSPIESVVVEGPNIIERGPGADFPELCHNLEQIDADNSDTAVDIETLYGDIAGPLVWCVGFSPRPDFAFVVPLLQDFKFAWPMPQESHLLKLISKFFLNLKADKIFQNGLYDLSILGRYYGLRVASDTYQDTMYCHHASYPFLKKGLEVLASIYTWEPYYKDEGKVNMGKRSGDLAEFIYNGKDCCTTREIWDHVRDDARVHSTWEGYQRSMSIMPSLLGMMIRGVKIDVEAKARLGAQFKQKAHYHEQALWQTDGAVNLNSPKQLKALLYYKYGLDEQYKGYGKYRKVTTDKDALQKLRRIYPKVEVLEHILEYRKFNKLASTYTSIEIEADGRIRTSYSLVSTWRLNSKESAFGGGGNLQNIPVRTEEGRLVRKLFIPDEGKILLACDLSQAEARVVAWEAEDGPKIDQFLSGIDVHWENAKAIFVIPKEVPYNPKALFKDYITRESHSLKEYRDIGKTVVHAANYGMGPRMLQTILARQGFILDYSTCKSLLKSYQDKNPFLASWHRGIRNQIKGYRLLVSSFGRKRMFMGRFNDNLWRAAYAFSPQNTVGEMLQVSIQAIWNDCPQLDPLLNVHDEIVCQVYPEAVPEAMTQIRERMSIPLTINRRELIIPCDFKSGTDWGSLKPIEEAE